MAKICVSGDLVSVASGKHVKVLDRTKQGQTYTLEVPPQKNAEQEVKLTKKHGRESAETPMLVIQCLRACSCGRHLAACDSSKGLSVWSLSPQYKLIFHRPLQRNALCLTFLNQCSQIIVADKTGDVFLYDLSAPDDESKGKLLFGHLSVILDIVVSPDGRRIITCDRDEKIRVSCYPNCYNISSFCLGHSEFIIRMIIFPNKPHVLVSASGDGTIKFWQYDVGKILHTINCADSVVVQDAITEQKDSAIEESRLVIKNIALSSDKQPIIVVLFHKLLMVGLYQSTFCEESGTVCSNHLQNLSLQSEPWDACWDSRGTLLVLCPTENETIRVFNKSENDSTRFDTHCADEDTINVVNEINRSWTFFSVSLDIPSIIPRLFKQWFDNVNSYLATKEERLKKSSSNVAATKEKECVLTNSKRQKTDGNE